MNVSFCEPKIPDIQITGFSKLVFKHRSDFPNLGQNNVLYIATDEQVIYIYDDALNIYKPTGAGYVDIDEISVFLKED